MINSQDVKAQTSQFKLKSKTKSEIFIVKPNHQSKNIQIRTQNSPLQQQQRKRSQTSLITTTKDPPPREGYRTSLTREQLRVVNEDLFDQFMKDLFNKPLNLAFEPIVKQMFQCDKCIIWIDNFEEKYLYSPTYNLKAGYDNTLPGFIYRTQSIIQVRDPSNAPNGFKSDSKLVHPKSPQLFFSLNTRNTSRAVVQIIQKPNSAGFSKTDTETANLIISKFSIYGDTIFSSDKVSKIAESLYSFSPTPINPLDLITSHFGCDICELWKFDTTRNTGQRVIDSFQKDPPISIENCGIVGDAILNNRPINLSNPESDKSYSSEIDGQFPGPILVSTTEPGLRYSWAIVLRGRESQFSSSDEVQLHSLLPFVVGSITGFSSNDNQSILFQQLSELLKTASILTDKISNADLIKTIREEATRLIECESCSLFLLSTDKEYLNGYYKNDSHKRFPISNGICSHVIQTGETVSLMNPSESKFYDSQIDSDDYSKSSVSPSSILVAPIRNFNGEIIGCIELLSKTNTDRFTEIDQKVLSAFNVFAGIAIVNTRDYRLAANLSKKLRVFIEMLLRSNKENELLPLLEDILDTAKQFMHARRLTFYISEGSQLSLFLNVGEEANYGTIFTDISREKGEMSTFSEEQIIDLLKSQKMAETESGQNLQEAALPNISKISEIFDSSADNSSQKVPPSAQNETLCCIPLYNHEAAVLGILEMSFTNLFIDEDYELIDSFASIVALSIERINLQRMSSMGNGPFDINDWMSQEERRMTDSIPPKLFLSDEIFSSDFDVDRYNGIDLIKIIFKIFYKFDLLKTYGINNQMLFNFIEATRATYSKTHCHNWKHAVDTLQFIAYQIIAGDLEKQHIGHFEQLALFISSLVHDADHQWFKEHENKNDDNIFEDIFGQASDEEQILIPLEILMQKSSLLETRHIETAISIITSRNDCNILITLNESQYEAMWMLIIDLIISADMRKHFKIVEKLKSLLDTEKFNPSADEKHRLVLMKALMKAADLSKIIRPITDSKNNLYDWNADIAEQFFRQGRLKDTPGMVFISCEKDFAHLDKDASLMGFFNEVCLPLFDEIARAVPGLKENADKVKDNIQKWAEITERAIPT